MSLTWRWWLEVISGSDIINFSDDVTEMSGYDIIQLKPKKSTGKIGFQLSQEVVWNPTLRMLSHVLHGFGVSCLSFWEAWKPSQELGCNMSKPPHFSWWTQRWHCMTHYYTNTQALGQVVIPLSAIVYAPSTPTPPRNKKIKKLKGEQVSIHKPTSGCLQNFQKFIATKIPWDWCPLNSSNTSNFKSKRINFECQYYWEVSEPYM